MSDREAAAEVEANSDGYLRIVDEHSAGPNVTPEPAPADDRLIGLWAMGIGIGLAAFAIVGWWVRRHVRITIR